LNAGSENVRTQGWWFGLVVAAAICMANGVHAQVSSLERLVMPGPVSAAHADTESTCAACHAPFSRGEQNALCLECHEDVARDITNSAGFHGRDAGVVGVQCSTCHAEHEGRDHDILGLDEDNFDHDLTSFPLLGKHAEVMCVDCHAEDAKNYHAAETTCNACHADDDQHKGNLGTECAECHSETAWTDTHFDHEMTTDYALTGKHAEITCVSCHVDEQYEDTPDTCFGCHAEDDSHDGLNGRECQECHTTRNWQDTLFDHLVRTGFALSGAHDGLECASCHEGSRIDANISSECIACHREDDSHDGINGIVCNDCHRPTEWLDVTFDHNRDTDFALHTAHADLECAECHVEPVAVAVPSTICFDCHADDDPHSGQLGESCDSCHSDTQTAWPEGVRFDHDLTRFPLLGKHDTLECDDCHATRAFHDAEETCIECHVEDDVHERRLGNACETCHNPSAWLAWTFDHDTQTDFALTGAHEGLDCHSCHREPVETAIVLSTTCASCHRSDDAHDGEFGPDCEQCHTTESFSALKELL
jgi:hypothetical protein